MLRVSILFVWSFFLCTILFDHAFHTLYEWSMVEVLCLMHRQTEQTNFICFAFDLIFRLVFIVVYYVEVGQSCENEPIFSFARTGL